MGRLPVALLKRRDRGRASRDWSPRGRLYENTTRLLDLLVATVLLCVFSPAWVAVAAAIRATSPGPALYRRVVIGQGGKRFTYYKFRTMLEGDDSHHTQWLRDFVTRDAAYRDGQFKVVGDPRITSVGRVLRRWSLDEIPQLLNVLKGDMSLVGPRPPIPYEFELYDSAAKRRLAVKPGITGLYQVTARSQVPFSQMLALDLDYIEHRTVWLNVKIMLRTLGAMAHGRGAA